MLFSLGYLLAMRKVLVAHPGAVVPTYLDDTTILGRTGPGITADPVLATLKSEAAALNLYFNWSKTKFFFRGRDAPEGFSCDSAEVATDGVISVGVPMGSDAYIRRHVADKLSTSLLQLKRLPLVNNFQCALLALRKSLVPRPRFLASTLSWDAVRSSFSTWDDAMRLTLQGLFKTEYLHPRCFYSRKGGLGIAVMSDEFAINRLNGWDRSMRIIRSYWPDLTHLTDFSDTSPHPVHREVLAAWVSLPDMVKLGADV